MHRPRAVQVLHFEDESEQMQGFAYADWAGERPQMKSTSGVLLMWESSLLRSWSSTQNTTALSSAESELCAMSKCAQHALHLKSMGEDFGIVLKPWIRSDASAALGIACRRGLAGKTRHVQVQYLCIQQEVANEHVKIQMVLGTDNPADALTKFFPEAELERQNADLRVEKSTVEFQHIQELDRRLKYFNKHTALAASQCKFLEDHLDQLHSDVGSTRESPIRGEC